MTVALGWLHFGKVPLLAILIIFLTTFAVAASSPVRSESPIGYFLPTLLAAGIAFVAGLLGVRIWGALWVR